MPEQTHTSQLQAYGSFRLPARKWEGKKRTVGGACLPESTDPAGEATTWNRPKKSMYRHVRCTAVNLSYAGFKFLQDCPLQDNSTGFHWSKTNRPWKEYKSRRNVRAVCLPEQAVINPEGWSKPTHITNVIYTGYLQKRWEADYEANPWDQPSPMHSSPAACR